MTGGRMATLVSLVILWLLSPVGDALAEQTLVVSQRAEPRTFNAASALDVPSREAIRLMFSDLVRIDRATLRTEPSLAESWSVSPDLTSFTVRLRSALRFSDGAPLTAADVVFSFAVLLDPRVGSPQRDLLLVGGRPPQVTEVDARTVRITFAAPYAPAERLFDSLYVLPQHKLRAAFDQGTLATTWGPSTSPADLVGNGPFRLVAYEAGKRLLFERNPHYWRRDARGRPLPHLDRLEIRFLPDTEAEALQLRAGQIDALARVPARTFTALRDALSATRYQFLDSGPSLEYHFLFFNLGAAARIPAEVRRRQEWFRQVEFRRAISLAIDRQSVRRLAYGGRATAIWQPVTPANGQWFDASLPRPARAIPQARAILERSGFRRNSDGRLLDAAGEAVAFSIVTNAANAPHVQAAAIIQQDLRELGIAVQVVPLEFRSLVDRVLNRRDYDAAFMALAAGDADPAPEMSVWLSTGRSHFWDPEPAAIPPWQREIDELMRAQLSEADPRARVRLYHRVQRIAQQELPIICVVSPHTLTIARRELRNVRANLLPPYLLAAADELYWDGQR